MTKADFHLIADALNRASVRFLLVGGLAVVEHGYSRNTFDVDLVLQLTPDTIARAFKALEELDYRPRVPITSEQFGLPVMTTPNDPEVDWNLTTWKSSRRKQHQEFHALPFSRKLEIIEEMNRHSLATIEERRKRGLPYIDPHTGERVARSKVCEQPTESEKSNPGNS